MSSNRYNINYQIKSKWLSELRLYCSCKGFLAKYYRHMELDNYPILERIEPQLPGNFDNQYNEMTYFRTIVEFTVNLKTTKTYSGSPVTVEFSLAVSSGAQGSVFIDGDEVITIPTNIRVKNAVSCSSSETYTETNYVTGEQTPTGCCFGSNQEHLLRY